MCAGAPGPAKASQSPSRQDRSRSTRPARVTRVQQLDGASVWNPTLVHAGRASRADVAGVEHPRQHPVHPDEAAQVRRPEVVSHTDLPGSVSNCMAPYAWAARGHGRTAARSSERLCGSRLSSHRSTVSLSRGAAHPATSGPSATRSPCTRFHLGGRRTALAGLGAGSAEAALAAGGSASAASGVRPPAHLQSGWRSCATPLAASTPGRVYSELSSGSVGQPSPSSATCSQPSHWQT